MTVKHPPRPPTIFDSEVNTITLPYHPRSSACFASPISFSLARIMTSAWSSGRFGINVRSNGSRQVGHLCAKLVRNPRPSLQMVHTECPFLHSITECSHSSRHKGQSMVDILGRGRYPKKIFFWDPSFEIQLFSDSSVLFWDSYFFEIQFFQVLFLSKGK